jgi:hypothetical protein
MKMEYTAHLTLPLIYAQKRALHMKFCVSLMKALLDAKVHMNAIHGQKMTWMNIARAHLIAQSIVNQMSSIAHKGTMKVVASYPMSALKRKEVLTENYAPSIAQRYVMMNNYSALEESTKVDVKDQVNAEIKNNTNGDRGLSPNQNKTALDIAQPHAKHMKSYAHHSWTLVMAAQPKKYAEKPSKTKPVFSVQERKSQAKTHKTPL